MTPQSTEPTVKCLILDFGEVLTRAQPSHLVEKMARIAGVPIDDFQSRYWRHRAEYDGGLTGSEYWTRVLDGLEVSAARIEQLTEADAASWSDLRVDMWDLAAAFRARGGRTAMLSNGVHEVIARIRAGRRLETWFDAVVVSCEVGRCKPDPVIYRICLDRLGCSAADTLFVDDRVENLEAAAAEGLRTLHFTGDATVRALRELLRL
jgi:putative hydrolase of the HAD superfamily